MAGAATTTGFDGIAQAEPRLTPTQVKTEVDTLYREAESATQKYDGAKEQADAGERRLTSLRDEAARKTQKLNSARDALGTFAAARPPVVVLTSNRSRELHDALRRRCLLALHHVPHRLGACMLRL